MSLPTRWELEDDICTAYFIPDGSSSPIHWHSHYLLALYTGGSCTHILNGQEIRVGRGDMFLLSPFDFHCNNTAENEHFEYYGVKFHCDFDTGILASAFSGCEFPLHAELREDDLALAETLLRRLVDECRSPSGASRAFKLASVEYLLLMLLRAVKDDSAEPLPANAVLHRALSFIHAHFREPVTVAEISRAVGYTPHYFSSFFKAQTGTSCRMYIQHLRLEFARKLLRSGNLSVSDVCSASGFNSLSYFSKAFHKAYGRSPAEYARIGSELSPSIQED